MRKYTSIFAHVEDHHVIRTLQDLKKAGDYNTCLGLFCNGIPVGSARIEMKSFKKKWVHTTSTGLYRGMRRKGHGIELYRALIETARNIGAARIYSDDSLNKFSRRMWNTKLARLGYEVKRVKGGCATPCRHCRRRQRYYIDL